MKSKKHREWKGKGPGSQRGVDDERRLALLSGKLFKQPVARKKKSVRKQEELKPPEIKIIPEHVEIPEIFSLDDCPTFSVDDEGDGLVCCDALGKLVSLYLSAANDKSCHIAMCYPVLPRYVSLIHAQACMVRLVAGDKRGVCGVLYPTKSNLKHALNHVSWDGQAIIRLASELAEAGDAAPKDRVVRSCPEKDSFLFFLRPIGIDTVIDPVVSDLIPTFYSGQHFQTWSDQASSLMATVAVNWSRRNYKAEFKQTTCEALGHPQHGTDALFGLDGRLSEDDTVAALRELNQRSDEPEVLTVVLSGRQRRENPAWSRDAIRFLTTAKKSLSKPCGVLVLCDDPQVAIDFQEEWHQKELQSESPRAIHLHGMISTEDGYGLARPAESKPHIDCLALRLEMIDNLANQLSRKLYRVSYLSGLNEAKDNPIRDLIGYLSRVSSLPCGTKDLTKFILAGDLSEGSARLYSFALVSGAVRDAIKGGSIQSGDADVIGLIDQLKEMIEHYEEQTPLALRMVRLLEDVIPRPKRRVVLAFNSNLRLRLAQMFLARYQAYPNGVSWESFQNRVVFLHVDQLEARLDELAGEKLILVGASDEGLRIALTSNRISKHTYLLLTVRSAFFLRRQLLALMKYFKAPFAPMRTRVDSLLKRLNELAISKDILNAIIPKSTIDPPDLRLDLDGGSRTDTSQDGWEPGDIVIHAEGHKAMAKDPESSIFVYDPTNASSTERGFRMVLARDLKAGDQWFIMSADLRERLREVLKEYGQSVAPDGNLEGMLRQYHKSVRDLFGQKYQQTTKIARVEALRADILREYPKVSTNFPMVQAMLRWVDLEQAEQTDFDDLRPQAPQTRKHFFAFAQTLGLGEELCRFMWGLAIKPVRSARRRGGRVISDMYAHVLLEPEYLEVMAAIPPRVSSQLFAAAREHVVPINRVRVFEGAQHHE